MKQPQAQRRGPHHASVGEYLSVVAKKPQAQRHDQGIDYKNNSKLPNKNKPITAFFLCISKKKTAQQHAKKGRKGRGGQKIAHMVPKQIGRHDCFPKWGCGLRVAKPNKPKIYNLRMFVWALGLNHQTAPLDLRGRFAFSRDQIAPSLQALRSSFKQHTETALLSTCNRTEIYCASQAPNTEGILHWLAQHGGISPDALRPHAYALQGSQTVRHAFRVASGLDSMVLGEPQILGQMKDAVRAAQDAGAVGTTLQHLFQRSFAVAKEVRSNTDIGVHSISMAAAAVRLASQIFENLNSINLLLVGSGEMVELTATHFAAKHPKSMAIANRTLARGEKIASRFGAEVMPLRDLPERLHEFDAVISCTASSLPIIGLGAVERALKRRRQRPMFMVDLAVPRDIEQEVQQLDNVYLYTVDDLAQVVQTGQSQRQAAVAQAEVIVDAGVQNFLHWLNLRSAVPLIQEIQKQAKEWQATEVARAQKMLGKGESVDVVLQALAQGLSQKMLHGAFAQLHEADTHQQEHAVQYIGKMFLRGHATKEHDKEP